VQITFVSPISSAQIPGMFDEISDFDGRFDLRRPSA
jgi:hypothetical protein